MFKLKISGLSEALELSQEWATHTVSLLDPDIDKFPEPVKLPTPHREALLRRYYFYDLSPTDVSNEYLNLVATSEHIQDILEFTAPLTSIDKLLVHCHAGVSRSTAVACGVLCQHGILPKLAIKYVSLIQELAYPNQHILTLFDEILGLEGKLIAASKRCPNYSIYTL